MTVPVSASPLLKNTVDYYKLRKRLDMSELVLLNSFLMPMIRKKAFILWK